MTLIEAMFGKARAGGVGPALPKLVVEGWRDRVLTPPAMLTRWSLHEPLMRDPASAIAMGNAASRGCWRSSSLDTESGRIAKSHRVSLSISRCGEDQGGGRLRGVALHLNIRTNASRWPACEQKAGNPAASAPRYRSADRQ